MESKITSFPKIKNKKTLIIILIIGIVLLLIPTTPNTKKEIPSPSGQINSQEYLEQLEDDLTEILEQVEGAGKVSVFLTAKSYGKISVAKNNKENQTGSEHTSESSIVMSGNESPVILEEYYPTIGGAVIVSEGAESEQIKQNLKRAAATALQIGINRIEVLEGSKKH